MFSEKLDKKRKLKKVEASNICNTANTEHRLILSKIKIKVHSKRLIKTEFLFVDTSHPAFTKLQDILEGK